MGLQQFEERLERLVEGTLAKPFRSNLQPVEIGRRLTREMDLHRRVGVRGLIAPNSFAVTLATADVERFSNFIDALCRELAEAAREHARIENYALVGPVDVQIYEGERLRPGRFAISAEVVEGADVVEGSALDEETRVGSGTGVSAPPAPAAVVLPDGKRVVIGADPVVIGRLPDCAVVLSDPNVSRRHAEVRRVADAVVVRDLGSTNGTRVNGTPVHEQALSSGDVISLGSSTVTFDQP